MSDESLFVVWPRFWPLWVRTAALVQGCLAILVLLSWAHRAVTDGVLFDRQDVVILGSCCSFGIVVPLGAAALQRATGRATLTELGLHPTYSILRPGLPRCILWRDVAVVRRRHGLLTGKWLWVEAETGQSITLPERPADFDGFRAAVERFAGEAHPLARALAEVAEEG